MKAHAILCLWYQLLSAWINDLDIQFLLWFTVESFICSRHSVWDKKLWSKTVQKAPVFFIQCFYYLFVCEAILLTSPLWVSLLGIHTCGIVICSTDADVFSHFSDARTCLLPVWQGQKKRLGCCQTDRALYLCLYIFLWSKCQLNPRLIVILTHLAWWGNLEVGEVEQLILFKCLSKAGSRQEKKCLCRFSEFNLLCLCQCRACMCVSIESPEQFPLEGEPWRPIENEMVYFIIKWILLFTVCCSWSVIIPASVHDSNSY